MGTARSQHSKLASFLHFAAARRRVWVAAPGDWLFLARADLLACSRSTGFSLFFSCVTGFSLSGVLTACQNRRAAQRFWHLVVHAFSETALGERGPCGAAEHRLKSVVRERAVSSTRGICFSLPFGPGFQAARNVSIAPGTAREPRVHGPRATPSTGRVASRAPAARCPPARCG